LSDRITLPISGSYSFKASIADSAFRSYQSRIKRSRMIALSYVSLLPLPATLLQQHWL
jgi:hypothetical protein